MAIEITQGKDYMRMTDTLDETHQLIIDEDGKYLLFSIEFKNKHDKYFDDEDKRLVKNILETGTKQQLAELLNLQFQTEYDSLVELLKVEGERLKNGKQFRKSVPNATK